MSNPYLDTSESGEAKLFIQDWRGPGKAINAPWVKMDPAPAICSVSPAWGNAGWQRKPRPDAPTLIGDSMGYMMYNGIVSGSGGPPTDPFYAIGNFARAHGYDIFPMRRPDGGIEGHTFTNFFDGRVRTCMINVARPEVAKWLGEIMAHLFPFSDGWHVDYWNPLGWLFPDIMKWNVPYVGVGEPDDSFWTAWTSGMNRCIRYYRAARAAVGLRTIVIGQQYKNGVDDQINMRFCEQGP